MQKNHKEKSKYVTPRLHSQALVYWKGGSCEHSTNEGLAMSNILDVEL